MLEVLHEDRIALKERAVDWELQCRLQDVRIAFLIRLERKSLTLRHDVINVDVGVNVRLAIVVRFDKESQYRILILQRMIETPGSNLDIRFQRRCQFNL